MTGYTPRIWLGLGLSVLAAGPVLAADACIVPAIASDATDSSGEGESGAISPEGKVLVLDRMAAQLEAAAALAAEGRTDDAATLVASATDEGPARLTRSTQAPDAALDAALAPLIAAPEDAAARDQALRGIEAALAALPETAAPLSSVDRAARLSAAGLRAFADALDCGRLADRAAYAEAHASLARAAALSSGRMAAALAAVLPLVPATPADPLPPFGLVSAQVSRVLIVAADLRR